MSEPREDPVKGVGQEQASDSGPAQGGPGGSEEGTRERGARRGRVRRFVSRSLLAGFVVVLGLILILTRTAFGKELVLREVLQRVGSGLNGQIQVEGISSPGFLRGFTFRNVSIVGADGRSFLVADSIRARVSAPALLRGDLILSGVRAWRPRIRIEQLAGQDRVNVVSIFVGESAPDTVPLPPDSLRPSDSLPPSESRMEEGSDTVGESPEGDTPARRTIVLRDARIVDGDLDILLPLPRGANRERILVEPAPDGDGLLRRYSFRDLNLDLEQASIQAPGQRGERFEFNHLAMTGEVWPDPFEVTGGEGEVRREGRRVLASFRRLEMPGSDVTGQADVRWGDDAGVVLEVEGTASPMALDDLSFIEDRLPSGLVEGPFGFRLDDDDFALSFLDTKLESSLGVLTATGGLGLSNPMRFDQLALGFDSLDLAITDPWVKDTLPLRGRITGQMDLSGSLAELTLDGQVDLVDPESDGVLTAHVTGRMGLDGGFSASSVQLTLAPLDWGSLSSLSPAMTLQGTGAIRMVFTGSLWGDGLGVDGELTHVPLAIGPGARPSEVATAGTSLSRAGGVSRVTLRGRVSRDSTATYLDLNGNLAPLSLTALRRSFPDLPVQGEYSGAVEARGPLSDLSIRADLETSAGTLLLSTRFDARDPAAAYAVDAEARGDFFLSRILPGLPDPTRIQGRISATGRGLTLDALQGQAEALVVQGSVGSLAVDTASMRARVEDGVLHLEEFMAETRAGDLAGAGTFGLAEGAAGELELAFSSPSIEAIRPFLMDEPTLIRDELTDLMESALLLEGVDVDTLPTSAEVAVDGSVEGRVILRGGARDFGGEGEFRFAGLRFRTDYVEAGEVQFTAQGFPGGDGRVQAQIRTDSINIRDLGFGGGTAEVDLGRRDGRVRVTASRPPADDYAVRGTYVLDSLGGGRVNVDQLTLQFDTVRWNLGGPSSFDWGEDGYRFRDFQVVRAGGDGMRIRADGFLPFRADEETDFLLSARELNLGRLARALQIGTPIEGTVSVEARMTGSPRNPRMEGAVSGQRLRVGDFRLGRLASDFDYGEDRLTFDLSAHDGGQRVLTADGFFPADLRVRPRGSRMPDGPVDLRLAVDSFPAATALAFLEGLEEVEGTLTGDLHFLGRSSDLEPTGNLRLSRGSAFFTPLGVRHRDVEGDFRLSPDGSVEVEASLRSGGSATVSGWVRLADPLSDPDLNLRVTANDFLAVQRRDVMARLSGSVLVSQSYRRPRVEGSATVEQGVMMVEEVARSVEVVDLSNPAFFNVVDTALVTLRPIIQSSQNPFLQNLMLNVDLTMAQDSWLRGRDMNVEMAGNLGVYWDRTERTMAFLGVLDAVRGVYSVLGRQFQVEEGTVSFPGTPGVNPDLNIRAQNRLRTTTNQTLEIIATVDGSLLEPRVSLSSNSTFPISESDLVSYLVFGRPSYDLASGQRNQIADAAQVLGGAASSIALGLASSEIGALLAPGLPFDYLAITQEYGADMGLNAGLFSQTQVAIGKYLTNDIFAAVHWRPRLSGTSQSRLAALRLEAKLGDNWTLEGYWEDRFFRNSIFQIVGLGADEHSLGFFLFREWGY